MKTIWVQSFQAPSNFWAVLSM